MEKFNEEIISDFMKLNFQVFFNECEIEFTIIILCCMRAKNNADFFG